MIDLINKKDFVLEESVKIDSDITKVLFHFAGKDNINDCLTSANFWGYSIMDDKYALEYASKTGYYEIFFLDKKTYKRGYVEEYEYCFDKLERIKEDIILKTTLEYIDKERKNLQWRDIEKIFFKLDSYKEIRKDKVINNFGTVCLKDNAMRFNGLGKLLVERFKLEENVTNWYEVDGLNIAVDYSIVDKEINLCEIRIYLLNRFLIKEFNIVEL